MKPAPLMKTDPSLSTVHDQHISEAKDPNTDSQQLIRMIITYIKQVYRSTT